MTKDDRKNIIITEQMDCCKVHYHYRKNIITFYVKVVMIRGLSFWYV